MTGLYDEDIVIWSEQQAALLRRVAAGEALNEAPDWSNIVEEIESLGRSERHALSSQIGRILEHLIKLAASPATEPHRGWQETIFDAQREIEEVLDASPSLRPEVPTIIARQLTRARNRVRKQLDLYGEQPVVDLDTLNFGEEQVLG
jgi:Domain of unknown function DUF29